MDENEQPGDLRDYLVEAEALVTEWYSGGRLYPVGGAIAVCDREKYEVARHYSKWPTEGYRIV